MSRTFGPRLPEMHQEQDELACLNLNIVRPAVGSTLPVLVWIHG